MNSAQSQPIIPRVGTAFDAHQIEEGKDPVATAREQLRAAGKHVPGECADAGDADE